MLLNIRPATIRHLTSRLLLSFLIVAVSFGVAVAADSWPSKTIRIIVPFAPGGPADVSARLLAEVLGPQLGQPIVVENRAGAGGAIGVVAAAQSKDGHTLLMGSNSMVINPSLTPNIGYDVARDFDAIGMVGAQPLVLVVPAGSPIRSFGDLVSQHRGKSEQLTAGNSGPGTLAHLTSELFATETGVPISPVPYRGESALMPDLISGRIALGFLNLPSVAALVKEGQLRALAVSSPQAVVDMPTVPTFRSLNYATLEVQGWSALLAPKGSIPEEALARLSDLLSKALRSELVIGKLASLSQVPVIQTRKETTDFLAAEMSRYATIIKAHDIKPQ